MGWNQSQGKTNPPSPRLDYAANEISFSDITQF